jgi:hypothetical protein
VPILARGLRPSAAQIWRVKAATEVLPLVPLTRRESLRLGAEEELRPPRAHNARRASPTRMEGDAVRQWHGRHPALAMIAAAPAAKRRPTKRRPSSFDPARATNRSPGLTVRLSALTPSRRARRSAHR